MPPTRPREAAALFMIAPIRRLARARLALDEPARFERLLSELSSRLVGAPAESIDEEIRRFRTYALGRRLKERQPTIEMACIDGQ